MSKRPEENGRGSEEGLKGGKVTCSGGGRTTVVTRGVEETDQYVSSLVHTHSTV